MTAPCTVGDLAPDARGELDRYLDAVAATVDDDLRDAVVCDLRTWMLDHLTRASTPADVRALAEQAGPVEQGADHVPSNAGRPLTGRLFGIPFDLRPPTAERIARRLWDPADPRIWRPHVFGAGWSPNLGAIAVRLGVIEPDAEAVPFASTPDRAFWWAAALPAALAGATAAHYLVRGRSLPARLPAHWGLDGSADRTTTRDRAAAFDLAASVVPASAAVGFLASGRPRPARAGAVAAASALSTHAALTAVWRSLPGRPRPWAPPALAAVLLAAPAATLLVLARAGRAAEIDADLGGAW